MPKVLQNKTIKTVLDTIKKYNMIESGDKILVGVSGGPDSTCLLHILYKLKKLLNIELISAHVNHCIREGTADEDEKFVIEFSKGLNIPVFSKRIDVKEIAKRKKISVEEAGREARYGYFEELFKAAGANKIAVAHNLNDNAETFLLNLIRGSGIEGLKGIDPVRGNIIRPLIKIPRDEIELYCKENMINARTDETNYQPIYVRNRVRLELIPLLKEKFNPNIISALNRTAEILSDERDFSLKIIDKTFNECLLKENKDAIELSLKHFNRLHDVLKQGIIRKAIEKIKGNKLAIEKVHINQVNELAKKGKTGAETSLTNGIHAKIQYDLLAIEKKPRKQAEYCYNISIPGTTVIPETGGELVSEICDISKLNPNEKYSNMNKCAFDKHKIQGELVLRNRRDGDRINPSGMTGTKKLKDFFIDEKIPREEREITPLIAQGNEILWVIGKRYSGKYKVTEHTKEVLVLEYLLQK